MTDEEKKKSIEHLKEIIQDIEDSNVDSFFIIAKGRTEYDGVSHSVHNEYCVDIGSLIHRIRLFLDIIDEKMKSKLNEHIRFIGDEHD